MEITDEEYARLEPLMPIVRGNGKIDGRTTLNAMLFIAENGCKWRSLPERFGNWHSIYMKVNRWAKKGVLSRLFAALKIKGSDIMFLDSTSVKVHPHGVGALKKTENKVSGNREAGLTQRYMLSLRASGRRSQ